MTAVAGSSLCGDPPHSPPSRCETLPDQLLGLLGNHCSEQSVVAPKCQSLSPWRPLGGLPGSSLCGQRLRLEGVSILMGCSRDTLPWQSSSLEPRTATSLPGALGPLSAHHSPGLPSDFACLTVLGPCRYLALVWCQCWEGARCLPHLGWEGTPGWDLVL